MTTPTPTKPAAATKPAKAAPLPIAAAPLPAAPAPLPAAAAPLPAAPAPAAPVAAEAAPASVEGEGGSKREYKSREETAIFWQEKIEKLNKAHAAKLERYTAFLTEATRPRQRAHVNPEAVANIVATMTESEIRQQRAAFEAALRTFKPAAEGSDTAPAVAAADGVEPEAAAS